MSKFDNKTVVEFDHFKLCHKLLNGILDYGYVSPTPIQIKTIPLIISGKDVIATAPPGSGRTSAFLISMFEKLKNFFVKSESTGPKALLICETHEFALQTLKLALELGHYMQIKATVFGKDFHVEHENPHIIIATPVQIEMICTLNLENVDFVMFEGDRLFETEPMVKQLAELFVRLPLSRQTVIFSTRLPLKLVQFTNASLVNPMFVNVKEIENEKNIDEEFQDILECLENDEKEDFNDLFDNENGLQNDFDNPEPEEDKTVDSVASIQILLIENEESEKMEDHDKEDDESSDSSNEVSLSKLKQQYEDPWINKNNAVHEERMGDTIVTTTKMIEVKRKPHRSFISSECPLNIRSNVKLLMWNRDVALKSHFFSDGQMGFVEVDFRNQAIHHNLIYRHSPFEYRMGHANQFYLILIASTHKGDNRRDEYDRKTKENDETDIEEEDEEEDDGKTKKVEKTTWNNQNGSHILFRSLNATEKEWSNQLPKNEIPIGCCAVGRRHAVILTDKYLRYFDVAAGAFQVFIETIHGTPVTIAGFTGVDDKSPNGLLVVVVDDGQKLVWRLEQLASETKKWTQYGRLVGSFVSDWNQLPLSKNATLTWIGFSDSGALYTVDSNQRVRRLHIEVDEQLSQFRSSVMRWMPVLDLKLAMPKDRRNCDRYFPVGFSDRKREFTGAVTAICQDSRYPKMKPLPYCEVVPFSVPLLDPKSERSELEQSFMLNEFLPDWSLNPEGIYLEEKKLMLKLFASAVLQDEDVRAFEIAKLMPDSQVIQLAIRYAVGNKKLNLAQRLGPLALEKDNEKRSLIESANDEKEVAVVEKKVEIIKSVSPPKEKNKLSKKPVEKESEKPMSDRLLTFMNDDEKENELEEQPQTKTKEKSPSPIKLKPGVFIFDQLTQLSSKKAEVKSMYGLFGNFKPKGNSINLKRPSNRKVEVESSPKLKKKK